MGTLGPRTLKSMKVGLFLLATSTAFFATTSHRTYGQPEGTIAIDRALAIASFDATWRSALPFDPIQKRIVEGTWSAPKAGEAVADDDGQKRWRAIRANNAGWFNTGRMRMTTENGRRRRRFDLKYGYLFATAQVAAEQVRVLDAIGHTMVYVNGRPRVGDPFPYNDTRLPVLLKAGTNELLFALGGRTGRLRARLVAPSVGGVVFDGDTTLPDLIVGQEMAAVGAVLVRNATRAPLEGLAIETAWRARLTRFASRWAPSPPLRCARFRSTWRLPTSSPVPPLKSRETWNSTCAS